MAKYDFSEQEVNALKVLIDTAVKTLGMQAAAAGVQLTSKLNQPIQEKPVEEKKEEK